MGFLQQVEAAQTTPPDFERAVQDVAKKIKVPKKYTVEDAVSDYATGQGGEVFFKKVWLKGPRQEVEKKFLDEFAKVKSRLYTPLIKRYADTPYVGKLKAFLKDTPKDFDMEFCDDVEWGRWLAPSLSLYDFKGTREILMSKPKGIKEGVKKAAKELKRVFEKHLNLYYSKQNGMEAKFWKDVEKVVAKDRSPCVVRTLPLPNTTKNG